jgi:hypothetical protein
MVLTVTPPPLDFVARFETEVGSTTERKLSYLQRCPRVPVRSTNCHVALLPLTWRSLTETNLLHKHKRTKSCDERDLCLFRLFFVTVLVLYLLLYFLKENNGESIVRGKSFCSAFLFSRLAGGFFLPQFMARQVQYCWAPGIRVRSCPALPTTTFCVLCCVYYANVLRSNVLKVFRNCPHG